MRLVAILMITVFLSGCLSDEKIVTSGHYGPFAVGDRKPAALAKVEYLVGLRAVAPTASVDTLENPTSTSIHSFDRSNGLLVFLDHDPFPLRIEFQNDHVIAIPNRRSQCTASRSEMNVACEALNALASGIEIGMTREDVYKLVLEYQTQLPKQLGAFIPGYDFEAAPKNRSNEEYRTLLLQNDAWRFSGLQELSPYRNPYYSEITLYFQSEQLARIKHWSAPYELP